MPYLIRVILSPNKSGYVPRFTGGYVRGVFLDILREFDSRLANFIHDMPGIKPYAVEPLKPLDGDYSVGPGTMKVSEGEKYTIGFKLLKDDLGYYFLNQLMNYKKIKLGKVIFNLLEVSARKESYRDFLNQVLIGRISLSFLTPTFFKIKGKGFIYVLPDIRRIISNLLHIWNSIVDGDLYISVEPAMLAVEDGVYIRNVNVKTRELVIEGDKYQGFIGRAELVVTDKNPVAPAIIGTLLKFSEYSNIGEKRTYGLGVVKYAKLKSSNKNLLGNKSVTPTKN